MCAQRSEFTPREPLNLVGAPFQKCPMLVFPLLVPKSSHPKLAIRLLLAIPY